MDKQSEGKIFLNFKNCILPWTKSCLVCGEENKKGFRLRSRVENGVVVIDYIVKPEDAGWKEMAHGGISMILMDEVMTWAAMLFLHNACVAAEITCRMRKPIRINTKLRVEGWVCKGREKLVLTGSHILDEKEEILSVSSGKYFPMLPAEYNFCKSDFVSDSLDPDIIASIFKMT